GDGAAEHLRSVELAAARIRSSYYYPAHGVKCAMPKAPLPQLIEAWILVQHRGKNRGGPVIFDGAIGSSRSKPLAVTSCTLAVARLAVFRLADASQEPIPGDLDVVERRPGHYRKLLLGGRRRDMVGTLKRQEVGQGEKWPVV